MEVYRHKTQYYETDQMGIVHHSNYIRWFEEARTDFLEKLGMGYDRMEAEGIISPVLSVSCEYRTMTHFGETVAIAVALTNITVSGWSWHIRSAVRTPGRFGQWEAQSTVFLTGTVISFL